MNVVALVAPLQSPDISCIHLSLSLSHVSTYSILRQHSSFAQSVTDFVCLGNIMMWLWFSHLALRNQGTLVLPPPGHDRNCVNSSGFIILSDLTHLPSHYCRQVVLSTYNPVSMEPHCASHLCVTTWHLIWLVTASFICAIRMWVFFLERSLIGFISVAELYFNFTCSEQHFAYDSLNLW